MSSFLARELDAGDVVVPRDWQGRKDLTLKFVGAGGLAGAGEQES
jgi:hypothetical protein